MQSVAEEKIFKQGSTTFHQSSRFFPSTVREDVLRLYSFVRVADDYVDSIPRRTREFRALRGAWDDAKIDSDFDTRRSTQDTLNQRAVKNIVYLVRKYELDQEWVEAFLDAMQADLNPKGFTTLDGTLSYVYGSAEVIGLMLAQMMGLSGKAAPYAQIQGRAMQYINFIRDIGEDSRSGRNYFPQEDLEEVGLKNLRENTARANPLAFKEFVHQQLHRYIEWQTYASEGLTYIPKRMRVAVQTTIDMHSWTGRQIARNPLTVFDKQIRPSKFRVAGHGLKLLFEAR